MNETKRKGTGVHFYLNDAFLYYFSFPSPILATAVQQLQHHRPARPRLQRGEADLGPLCLRLLHDPHADLPSLAGLLLRPEHRWAKGGVRL